MSKVIYAAFIRFYWLSIWVASFFNRKAAQWINGRKYWNCAADRIELKRGKRYWFHCASLGEFEQARPVIEMVAANKQNFILLTFFSPSGFEVRKNYALADVVMYLPLDTAANADRFLDCFKPDVALFVKYEFWYNYLTALQQRGISTILFSSVFRSEQVFFKWYGGFFREMLHCFTKIFVQNENSKQLLQAISIESEVCFDTRFDRVIQIAEQRKTFADIQKFKQGYKVLIAGSTWPKDEELLLNCINEHWLRGYKYIIAPHDVNEQRLKELKTSLSGKFCYLSELTEANAEHVDVVIIDSIGQLASIYAYADLAYIGGGFSASVHNILEAAVYGVPVLYGPNYHKSQEANDLLRYKIDNDVSLKQAVTELIQDEALQKSIGKYNRDYVYNRAGGAEKIYQYLGTLKST